MSVLDQLPELLHESCGWPAIHHVVIEVYGQAQAFPDFDSPFSDNWFFADAADNHAERMCGIANPPAVALAEHPNGGQVNRANVSLPGMRTPADEPIKNVAEHGRQVQKPFY